MGRLGSLRPARELRIALATTVSASSWPTTRSRSRVSICVSFWTSPSSILVTGMPVHLLTIFAMSSSSTSSFSRRDGAAPLVFWVSFPEGICFSAATASSCASVSEANARSAAGISPYCSSAARCRLPLRVASLISKRNASSFSFSVAISPIAPRSFCQRARRPAASSCTSASSRSTSCRRSCEFTSSSRLSAARSISSDVARRSRMSISTGTLPIWMASAAAASSTRSMALSGRKRSEI